MMNNTIDNYLPEEHSVLLITILVTLYTLIFIIGITGNMLVVYVVCAKKTMQTVTNLFIMNLALSDIIMCLLCVPFTPISFFKEDWVLGKFLCHLIPFSLGISVYVSTLTSLAIAIDRYFVIVHPYKPRMKLGVCCLLISVVWILSVSISLPLAIYMELVQTDKNGMIISKCNESWPIPMSKRFFNIASLVLQYLVPFVVITYSYTKVWYILSKRNRPGRKNDEIDVKRKKRTNRMLVAMVIIFAGCWMPLNCVHLIMEFNQEFTKKTYFSKVFFIAHVIAMSSTIYNPFLYAWLNVNFRKEFRLILPWMFKFIKWCGNGDSNKQDENMYEDCEENVFEHAELINNNGKNNNNNNNNNKCLSTANGTKYKEPGANKKVSTQHTSAAAKYANRKPIAHSIKLNNFHGSFKSRKNLTKFNKDFQQPPPPPPSTNDNNYHNHSGDFGKHEKFTTQPLHETHIYSNPNENNL